MSTVESNFVADNSYTGPGANASSGGILVFGGCGDPLSIGVKVEGNVLSNNDVGIYLNNYSASCNAQASRKTNDMALNNTISNNAVTNMSAYVDANGHTYTGYQAGIDDVGNNDLISHNTITGMGYTPAQTAPAGPFISDKVVSERTREAGSVTGLPFVMPSYAIIKPMCKKLFSIHRQCRKETS